MKTFYVTCVALLPQGATKIGIVMQAHDVQHLYSQFKLLNAVANLFVPVEGGEVLELAEIRMGKQRGLEYIEA